jgi:hypothetical protein
MLGWLSSREMYNNVFPFLVCFTSRLLKIIYQKIMKVLMFGWVFPLNILRGLGTACNDSKKGLASFNDIELTFVVYKFYGKEKIS